MSIETSDIISISTNDLESRKKVQIIDAGVNGGKPHVYTLRKLGAGEEMDLSQIARELLKLLAKVETEEWTEKDAEIFDELKKRQLELYIKTFDDGKDGKMSKQLVESLSDTDRNTIYNQVFPKTNLQVLLESEMEDLSEDEPKVEEGAENGDTNS